MLDIAGIELLPPFATFLAFALAGLALNIVPGADMTFIIASAARGGRRDGIVAALGISGGALVHVFAAAIGLSALLAASQTAFAIVKWVGAAYLIYVAVSLLRSSKSSADAPQRKPQTGWRLFRAAAMVDLLNPKVALFFLAFLPQFVNPHAGIPAVQILCLGLWFDFAGTIVNMIIALVAARAAEQLRHFGWIGRASRYIAATTMGGLALKLAFAERR
jgi:threonine/homoserine/homoserine lactone efflux protein